MRERVQHGGRPRLPPRGARRRLGGPTRGEGVMYVHPRVEVGPGWSGRERGRRERLGRLGPGLSRLGIWPLGVRWLGRQGEPDRGPWQRVLKPRALQGAGAEPRAATGASPRLRGAREDAGQRGQRRGRLAGALESVDEDAGHQRSLQGGRRRAGPAVQVQRGAGVQVGD